ncbi:MAG: hypothetical protein R3E79_32475 [Caldilineaceae bacterium]
MKIWISTAGWRWPVVTLPVWIVPELIPTLLPESRDPECAGLPQRRRTGAQHTLWPADLSAGDLRLKHCAFANTYLVWPYEGFVAGLTDHAQTALTKAVTLHPALVAKLPVPFSNFCERSIQMAAITRWPFTGHGSVASTIGMDCEPHTVGDWAGRSAGWAA